MSINRAQQRETGIPQLRVFYGEEENKGSDNYPSDALRQARQTGAVRSLLGGTQPRDATFGCLVA